MEGEKRAGGNDGVGGGSTPPKRPLSACGQLARVYTTDAEKKPSVREWERKAAIFPAFVLL